MSCHRVRLILIVMVLTRIDQKWILFCDLDEGTFPVTPVQDLLTIPCFGEPNKVAGVDFLP